MHKKDMFFALESSLREMRELQKANPQAEDTPFMEPREEEEIDIEESGACEDIKKERQEKIKNMLADSTRVHQLLAKSFYKCHLEKNSNAHFANSTYNDYISDEE